MFGSHSELLLERHTNSRKVPPAGIQRRMSAVWGRPRVGVRTVRRWARRLTRGEVGHAEVSDRL